MKETFPEKPILLIDDEEDVLESYRMALKFDGITNCILLADSRNAFATLENTDVSLAVIDLFMPDVKGEEILSHVREKYPHIQVVVVTGSNSVDTAVACMKKGAFDYMVKPVESSRLVSSIRRALEVNDLASEVATLKKKVLSEGLENPGCFAAITTISQSMRSIFNYVEAVARTQKPVLICGESGVGKELVARAVHDSSGRKGNFVAVNLGGLDDTMFSDTLFGHRKGAFTGAESGRPGLIEQASGGTLFLDEIGDLDSGSQVKLLRLLQDREYYQLGSDVVKVSDARIVAATNADLEKKQAEGAFRNDLYYRLVTHCITIPPLRERMEDLPLLVDKFVGEASESISRPQPEIPDGLFEILGTYSFPGNVRELQSMIFDAVSRSGSPVLDLAPFEEYIEKRAGKGASAPRGAGGRCRISYTGKFPTLAEAEEFFMDEALKKANGSQTGAAALLGVNQSTLSRRLKEKKEKQAD